MKALIAENLLLKQQLFLLSRSRKRAPNLSPLDRFLLALWTIFLDPRRIKRTAMLRKKLIKIGAKVIHPARSFTFQLAEVAVPRELFETILQKIDRWRLVPETG